MAFFNSKNFSPSDLSIIAASIISIAVMGISYLFAHNWYTPLIFLVLTFILSYIIYFQILQKFVYRKIKLIYKLIYQTKASKKEEFFYQSILPQKSMNEVQVDVANWAQQRNQEIASLKQNEQFRKEFLTNLAHELKTPIFTIQGYIETLLDGAIDDQEINRKFLKNASRGIERLAELAANLDQISRLESGALPIDSSSFIIQDLVKELYEELSIKANARTIHLTFKKGTEQSISVYADRAKIKQVLTNLIDNAIKYGSEHGTITTGFYKMDEQRAYIEVSDDGSGIPEEHLPRLFERFYRADRSRNREVGGTGLGLAIVKHIIEAHGETINVRSKVGVGSSFGFTLPIKSKAANPLFFG